MRRRLLYSFLPAAALAVCGCGGVDDQPETGEVTGKVTLDGQPLADATVMFKPEQGRPSSGRTGADGTYVLQYNADTPGAKVGPHKVYISTYVEPRINDDTKKVEDPGVKEKVPRKYNQETTLTADVKSGDNDLPFELTSK